MPLKVAIIRDARYQKHQTGNSHPEHPRRLASVYRMLDADFSKGLISVEPVPVPLEYLELVHTPAYIEKVLKTADHDFTSLAPDTPASSKSYLSAWLAVGGCMKGLDSLISGECDVCFALVRPPGHHALPDRAGGFCIFNNLGITARYATKQYRIRRILIIDWDIHHGNGIQQLFYNKKNVLYFSTHDMLLYPYTGDWDETGKDRGKGYTINIPLPREIKDAEFLYLYQKILDPVISQYCPELILVAAGFDAHHDDLIGRSQLTEKAFRWLTLLLLNLRARINHPPILFSLEGGYNPKSLTICVKEVLQALTEAETNQEIPAEKTQRVSKLVEKTYKIHSKYGVWGC